jgi:hypothetical protein
MTSALPRRSFVLAAALLALSPSLAGADGKPKVEVAAVEITSAEIAKAQQKRVRGIVRRAAHRAAKNLDFGRGGRVEIGFVVRELTVEEDDDVVRVTCTLVGRLKGGGSARSKIRFGGKLGQRKKLERQVMEAATDGVMTRLAELSRRRTA